MIGSRALGPDPPEGGRTDGTVADTVTLFLCGDVMTGRGVDQILPHPSDPVLRENWIRDARRYVALAEAANGPIPRLVGFDWPWGDALDVLAQRAPGASVINLETAVTRGGEFTQGKAIHYRMNPANLPCLAAAVPDVCVLANNHVLDFGRPGLDDTLAALSGAGLATVGAGADLHQARRPAVVALPGGGRVVVVAYGMASAGVPDSWAATGGRSGVAFLPDLSDEAADEIAGRVRAACGPGGVGVVSLHWGSNWGFDIPRDQVRFAHRLIDGGVDIVHGHSSHHPRPIEVYRKRLILYGCGDLINDYEGIAGYEEFRGDLRLLYFPEVRVPTGELAGLTMTVLRSRQLRLEHAPQADVSWTRKVLEETSQRFRTRIEEGPGEALTLPVG